MIEETEMHPPIAVCTKERKSQEFGSQGGHFLSLQVYKTNPQKPSPCIRIEIVVRKWFNRKQLNYTFSLSLMVSYMCLCIKLQSNPKSLCEDSFRTQLKTRESLCTSSKSNASSIDGNYATATSFTLLPSAAAITNIDQKVS